MTNPKIAIISITKHGSALARNLHREFPGSRLFISSKFRKEDDGQTVDYFDVPIAQLSETLFHQYDAIIYFVSLGAVVRTIARLLKDKKTDPAILSIDDKGKFVISVLSGHLGGANKLTQRIAELMWAVPVITTASDVGKTIPADILGREMGWVLENFDNVTHVSASIVNDEPVGVYQEAGERNWWRHETPLPANISPVSNLNELADPKYKAGLIISDRSLEAFPEVLLKKVTIYRPKSLVMGIGCDRGVDLDEVETLIQNTFKENHLSIKSVARIATIDIKGDEKALLELSDKFNIPLETFSKDELNSVAEKVNPSEMAMKYTGAVGVCEPAALLASGAAELLITKVKSKRVTLAVARKPF